MRALSPYLTVLVGAYLGFATLGHAQAPAGNAQQPGPAPQTTAAQPPAPKKNKTKAQTPASAQNAPPKKPTLDCSAQVYEALFCDELSTLFYAPDALNTDGTLNDTAGAMDDAVLHLLEPFSTNKAIFAFAPSAALEDEATQYANALKQWEASRLDKQIGSAAPSSTASTDVVAKPGAAGLLSLAAETGAFAQTINGNTITLNGNPWNAIHLARTGKLYDEDKVLCASNCVNPLRTTNVFVSFTVDQSSTITAASSGGANGSTQNIDSILVPTSQAKFSAITVQTNVWHSQDPASGNYQKAWNAAYNDQQKAIQEAGLALNTAVRPLLQLLQTPDAQTQIAAMHDTIEKVLARDIALRDGRRMVVDYENYLEQYLDLVRSKNPGGFNTLITNAAASLADYVNLNQNVINAARGKPMLTLEYTFSQPVSQPSTHDLRVVFGEQSAKTGAQITFNGAASFYQGRPSDAKYGPVKDVQVSGQFDCAVGNKQAPPLVVSVAGYGQYQFDPSVLNITSANVAPGMDITLPANAQQFLGSAGWLGVVQGKVTLRLQKSISIPLAIKWSNKTDLLDTPDTRGQIGLSYDFTSLVSLLKSK
jgi:hypothetical protein